MRKQQGRKLFTDHSVLSSLLHRIGKDDDKERRLSACQQLLDFLTNKDHSREIQKQNDSILTAISSVLCERASNAIKLELSQCIAAVSIHAGQDLKRFFGWAFSKFQNSSSDEYKTYMLYAIFQALRKNNSNPRLVPLMNGIMNDLQTTLENVDTPDLLVSVMNIVHYVSQQYPKIFSAFFKDTVDIIVGWYIDTTQKEVLIKYCEDSLSSFCRFWQADLSFSANLLSQFLEDMEAYAEDYHQQVQGSGAKGSGTASLRNDGFDNDEILTPNVCKSKILALLRVYTTVVKCLGKEFIPVSSPPITVDYISQVLTGIPKCTSILTANTPDRTLSHITTKCLIAVLDVIQDNLPKCKHDLFTFALSEVERVIKIEQAVGTDLVLHMTLLYKVIRHSRELVPPEIIQRLLEPGSKIATLKYHTNPQVVTCLMKTVQSLLNVKDVPTLELTYGFMLLDLHSSYNRLLSYLNSEVKCQLTSEGSNGIKESSLLDSIQGAELTVIFTLAALSDISSAKSSIMGMWVFSPSIFDLLTHHLSPTHWDIALGFPSTYYTILHMLYTHSKSNGHFISSSFGLTAASKTRTNFSKILAILPEVLTHPVVSDESRSLALHWMLSILQYLQQGSYSAVYLTLAFTQAVSTMIHVALHEEPSMTLQAAQCMGLVIKNTKPPKEFLISCLEVCRTRLVSSHDGVRRAFTDLMQSLPCDILYSSDIAPVSPSQHTEDKRDGRENNSDETIQNLHVLQKARQKHMGSIPNTTFNSHNYRTVMAYILMGEAPKNAGWLERLYHSCQRPHNSVDKYEKGTISFPAFINDNQAVQWFWATWEAANFCVLSKLRTPLGKPQETFTAIRSALGEFVTDMKTDDSSTNDKMPAFSEEYKCAQLRPVLLLQYLDHLEKLMYNAYEGSAVALPSMPKPVKAFFRTNRVTCHEGFALVRPLAYHLAMHCSQYATALHHAITMLQDMVTKNNTTGHAFEDCLQRVIAPLVKLQCPQSILGLQTWCEKVIGRSFSWPEPMALKADRKFESCVTDTLATIKDYLKLDEIPNHADLTKAHRITKATTRGSTPPESPPGGRDSMNPKLLTRGMEPPPPSQSGSVVEYLLLEVMDCYERLTDYDSALKWQESVKLLRGKVHTALQGNVKLPTDTNTLQALRHFNERDFPSVSDQLALIPGMSLDDLNPNEPSVSIATVHSPRLTLKAGQLEQARALTHYHLSGCATSFPTTSNKGVVFTHPQLSLVVDALSTVSKLAESSLQTVWLDWPVVPTPSHAMLLQTTHVIKKTIQDPSQLYMLPLSEDLQLNPSQHDLTMMTEAARVTSYQLHLHAQVNSPDSNMGTISELTCHLSKLRLATSRLARKQTNFLAAQKILLDQLDFIAPDRDDVQNLNKKLMNFEIHAKKPSQPLLTALSTLDSQSFTSLDVLRTERECCKLLHYMGNQMESWAQLSKTVVHYATLAVNPPYALLPSDASDMTDLCARSLLSMVKWMTADYRTALPYLKQCHRLDLSDAPELSCSLGTLLEMEKHGALQGLGLAAYGAREADVTNLIGQSPAVSDTDAVCGRLLHLGIMQSPTLPKAWSSLASWCYRWGRKAVDMASEDKGVSLTEGEKATVLSVLPAEITNAETDEILRVLSQAHCTISSMQEEDLVEQGQALYHDGSETTRLLLISVCPSLSDMDTSVMEHLLDVWTGVCRRIFSHYRLSVWSYFTFLKLNGGNALEGRASPIPQLNTSSNNAKTELNLNNSSAGGAIGGGQGGEGESVVGFGRQEDNNITATLRLLRLLVKYASELRDVLEEGFATTPTGPWKSIIPQLFSRLNHPESYVRQSISDLLCRIARDSPHLIVYQAVVGCPDTGTAEVENQIAQPSSITNFLTSPQVAPLQDGLLSPSQHGGTDSQQGEQDTDDDDDTQEEGEEDERKQHDHSMHLLEDCLRALVSTLSQHDANLVSQVEVLVQELRRITLLWEEVWIGTLTQIQSDVTRRLEKLEEEAKRVSRNESLEQRQKRALMLKKHQAIMKPIVFTLEQLHGITNKPADTPNERAFQDAFKDQLQCALKVLKYPDNPDQPQQSWAPFKQLGQMLQQRSNRRSTFLLQMSEISPKLAKMKSTAIPLPGHVCHTNQVIHIESFINSVNILPTKTKPKKLVFLGSDGKKYTYLFKGLEDLHLDERIMQFLSIVNCMFARNKRQDAPLFHACHYSVTPLGPRSGLISWVDGASALFSLYKRWQQREAMAAAASKAGDNTNPPPVAKPSEIFYNKVTKALKEEGLSSQTPRKDWPISMMRKVLTELMTDTPDYLLAKELWCSSGSASEWWHLTQSFGRSTAVMSMIGYIIGLGDRHLDNVLVNFVTGEVVHIDYNVCFEKGKNLRVPERVPFRMTQNVQAALGITGVEGNFRQSSEEVLKIMRKGRETLLNLLEAFVYDPLVDWTTGNDRGFAGGIYGGGQVNPAAPEVGLNKKEVEVEITRSLFQSRVFEMREAWTQNQEDMLDAMVKLEEHLDTLLEDVEEKREMEKDMVRYEEHQLEVQLALRDKDHSLHTLNERYREHRQQLEARDNVVKSVESQLQDLYNHHIQHKIALEAIQDLAALSQQVEQPLDVGVPSYVPAVGFLQNAGQAQMIQQCEQAESEMEKVLKQRRELVVSCVEILKAYYSMVTLFPPKFYEMTRTYVWHQWLQQLLQSFSSDTCADILASFESSYAPPTPARIQEIVAMEIQLQDLVGTASANLTLTAEWTIGSIDRETAEGQMAHNMEELQHWIQENESAAPPLVTLNMMNLLHMYASTTLLMENAMSANMSPEYSSRNGRWFLSELSGTLTNIVSCMGIISYGIQPESDDPCSLSNLITCFKAITAVYEQLQTVLQHFSDVASEAVRLIQSRDDSVTSSLAALDALCTDPQVPLQSIIYQIEADLRAAEPNSQASSSEIVKELRAKFDNLLHPSARNHKTPADDNHQTPDPAALQPPTMGQNLLAAINVLFKRLGQSLEEFSNCWDKVAFPQEWFRVDGVFFEAVSPKTMTVSSYTLPLLNDLFFVRQLQSAHDCLTKCRNHALALSGLPHDMADNGLVYQDINELMGFIHSDEMLVRPVKLFLVDFISTTLLGIPSTILGLCVCSLAHQLGLDTTNPDIYQPHNGPMDNLYKLPLDDLCQKAGKEAVETGRVDRPEGSSVQHFIRMYDTACRARGEACQQQQSLEQAQDINRRAQTQLLRFQWLYEDVLQAGGAERAGCQFIPPARSAIMSDMRKRLQALQSIEGAVGSMQERAVAVQGRVCQRLKWAAGANPSLASVMEDVDASIQVKTQLYTLETKRASEVGALCHAILHFEGMRTRTSESVFADNNFHDVLQRCLQVCNSLETRTANLSLAEEDYLSLKPLTIDRPINNKWIKGLSESIRKKVAEYQGKAAEAEAKIQADKETVQTMVDVVKMGLTTHNELMSEVKGMLRVIAEDEEGCRDGMAEAQRFKTFYKQYSQTFATMLGRILTTSSRENGEKLQALIEVKPTIHSLIDHVKGMYDRLVSIATQSTEDQNGKGDEQNVVSGSTEAPGSTDSSTTPKPSGGELTEEDTLRGKLTTKQQVKIKDVHHATPPAAKQGQAKGSPAIMRDPRTGKIIQVRNTYAINVWRRVKGKLDGRDPDPAKRLAVTEQVDYVIKEATSIDNLATLYEGWTAWV